jgi:hypothetical protein
MISIPLAAADFTFLRSEIAHLRDICGADDEELLRDMLEGSLNLETLVGKILQIVQCDEAFSEGLKAHQKALSDRKRRLDDRARKLRTLLATVVTELPGRTYRHPLAHLRAFDVDPRVVVIDETAIPSAFWIEQDPKLDEPAMRKHLLERRTRLAELSNCRTDEERRARQEEIDRALPDIPGTILANGEISIRIRSA